MLVGLMTADFQIMKEEIMNRLKKIWQHLAFGPQYIWWLSYLTLLKTMSTSVRVMFLPSITPQSLQSLDQFLPCISLPVARVSPWMAKRRKDSSKAVNSTGVDDPTPPSLVPLDSVESLLDARSLDCSLCGRKGTEPMLGCLAVWTLKSSALSLRGEKTQHHLIIHAT